MNEQSCIIPLFDATGSSVMFPDSLATEYALSDSRLKEQKDTISVVHTAGKWLSEKKILMKYLSPTQRLVKQ